MHVLVTGGGGFLGSHIAARLRERGDRVQVLGRKKYVFEGIESIQADVRDRDAVFSACEGKDAVFHAASIPLIWGDRKEFFDVNVEGTRNVIDACRKHSIKKLIYTSSPSVVFDSSDMEGVDESVPYPKSYLCDYPRTKAMAERLVLDSNGKDGLLTVSLRPHLIWGPGDTHLIPRILDRASKGRLIRVGDGRNKVDIIYIDNAVEAHIRACDCLVEGSPVAGHAYFVSDGKPVVLWDWINRLLEMQGLPRVSKSISYRGGYILGMLMEAAYHLFPIPGEPRMTRFLAAQLATSHYFDMSRARKDFAYNPIIDQEEGMRRLIQSLRSRPAG